MNIATIVGTRAELVQSSVLSPALHQRHDEILIHTGEQDNYALSQLMFEQLDLPMPDYRLGISTVGQSGQIAEMRIGLETVLRRVRPDVVLVHDDSNSALAGALAAAALGIPLAHLTAGERGQRPQTHLKRKAIDQIASLNLCATQTALQNLASEGQRQPAVWVGDLMCDAVLQNRLIAQHVSSISTRLNLERAHYALITVHAPENIGDARRLLGLVAALNALDEVVVFPVHPHTRKALQAMRIGFASHVRLIEPVGHFDMLALEEHARLIATDSSGVLREAYVLGVPCLTLLEDTEWVETVHEGGNCLLGANPEALVEAWEQTAPAGMRRPIFGDGQAAAHVAEALEALWPTAPVTITSLNSQPSLR